MKARKGSESSPDATIDSTPKFSVVEVELCYRNGSRTKRKIAIPHGQFTPPLVTRDDRTNHWFMWCAALGLYQEVEGAILANIEV